MALDPAILEGLLAGIPIDGGGCPAPFIGESLYPYKGGFRGGRNCAVNPLIPPGGNATRCCIPCPSYDSMYRDDWKRLTDGAAWVNVAGFILCGFLLLSHALLPAAVTRRAYLNIVLLVGIMILELGFIIPLARQPPQCFDPVTPNGQASNLTCAFSGAFAAFGGMFLVTWILIRALFMHLQICWNILPTRVYYIGANIAAFSTTIALVTATLANAGVSMRFGGYCHVNVGSLGTFWGWLLAFGCIAFLLQVATFAYVIKVYLSSALSGKSTPSGKSGSVASTTKTNSTARVSARRVQQVLLLQWRSLAIVSIAVFTIAFVCIIFIVFDDRLTVDATANEGDRLIPWITCILATQDKTQCFQYTKILIVSEDVAVATLFILGLVGVEAFLLLVRLDIFIGWKDFIMRAFRGKKKTEKGVSSLDRPAQAQQEQIQAQEAKMPAQESEAPGLAASERRDSEV